jgi:hypothetical protein
MIRPTRQQKEITMELKKLALAAAAGTTLLAAAPVFAQPQDWERDHDHRAQERRHDAEYYRHRDHRDYRDHRAPERDYRHSERVVVVPVAPVYYAPAPVQSRPGITAQVPIGRNANLTLDVQL